jgi:hypothetical protein
VSPDECRRKTIKPAFDNRAPVLPAAGAAQE